MQLTVTLGATVTCTVDGHSAVDGAPFPDGSTIAFTSNDPSVATVPADAPLSSGMSSVSVPVTVLASGSTDISATVTAPDGSQFTDTASLIVAPAVAGLTHVTLTLTSP
jgi:hypothetical protein